MVHVSDSFWKGKTQVQGTRVRVEKTVDLLNKLKEMKDGGSVDADEDIWAALRGQHCHGLRKPDSSSTHLLPGGIFIGKYHERVLANIQGGSKMDQKKKFEQFVAPKKDGK